MRRSTPAQFRYGMGSKSCNITPSGEGVSDRVTRSWTKFRRGDRRRTFILLLGIASAAISQPAAPLASDVNVKRGWASSIDDGDLYMGDRSLREAVIARGVSSNSQATSRF